ncbi:MAG: hypothetical protein R2789_17265 [Microthrixaceae bacterium]
MQIRPATLDDSGAILDIYNQQVLTSSATFDLVPARSRNNVPG